MIKITFICHGNICRSPMAEFIMKDKIKKANLEDRIYVDSCAVSNEEIGNGLYPPAKRELDKNNVPYGVHRAKRLTKEDGKNFDLLICMDKSNISNAMRIISENDRGKLKLLMDFTQRGGSVADPWYTGDFVCAYGDIDLGCTALLEFLKNGLSEK